MPTWGNTDVANAKPKFDVERQTREVYQYVTANSTAAGANTIVFTGTIPGVVAGQYGYAANLSSNGYAGFFAGNNTVASVTGNVVVFANNTTGTIPSGATVEFDTAIAYNTNKPVEVTYNQDTVLITATRAANTLINSGNYSAGWVHIQKKTNNDGTIRYLKETLVALANGTASNTSSGNTSWGGAVSGL